MFLQYCTLRSFSTEKEFFLQIFIFIGTKLIQFNNPKGKTGKELKLQCTEMPYGRGLNFTAGQTC
jgi:hypothetical protein